MAKANHPERNRSTQGRSDIENLPRDPTDADLISGETTGQLIGENLNPAGEDATSGAGAATKTHTAQERQSGRSTTTMQNKKGNQPGANPPKR